MKIRRRAGVFPKPILFFLPVLLLAVGLTFFISKRRANKMSQSNSVGDAGPSSVAPRAETPAEVILKLEKKLKRKPNNIGMLTQLANAYAAQQNIPKAYFLYKRILALSPNSIQGKQARHWIDQKVMRAKSEWRGNLGKQFQDISQLGYENITLKLASITRKVEKKQAAVAHEIESVTTESSQQKLQAAQKAKAKKEKTQQQPGLYILTPVSGTPSAK